jgi:GT2 family glycosyltransferase
MSSPDLSVIIVNWRSADYLKKCLKSVFANAAGLSLEVIVIDNASYDGCGEMIAREFPEVRFFQSPENLGFARANNLGFEHSSGKNLLFLNPDTEIVGSALQEMLASLERTPTAGIVGPKLLNSDLSIQTSCIQRFPTVLNQFLDSEYLRARFPRARIWGMRPLWERSGEPTEVEVISGACLMIKRDAFEQSGMFSPRYFMYSEDVDLCYEVRRLGRKILFAGKVTVIHHGGRSSSESEESHFASVMAKESIYRFFLDKRGRLYGALFRAVTVAAALFRLALCGAVIALPRHNRNQPARAAASKWRAILGWGLGRATSTGGVQKQPAIPQVQ